MVQHLIGLAREPLAIGLLFLFRSRTGLTGDGTWRPLPPIPGQTTRLADQCDLHPPLE